VVRDPKYDCLFEPIAIGPKVMKNRFYQVPHCTGAGSDRPGTQAGHRRMKAEGGWGAICTEAASIGPESDTEPSSVVRIWDEGDVRNLRPMTDAAHEHGALAGIELWHSCQEAPNQETRMPGAGVHAWQAETALQRYGYAADADEIRDWINDYVEAAKRARDAGFDLIYIYGAHRAAPAQFLSPRFNQRTDEYGGSFENRARFFLEALAGIKAAVGEACAGVARLTVDQLHGGSDVEVLDDGLRFIELAEMEGVVDLWDVNITKFMEWGEDAGPSRFYKANHQGAWTKHVKGVAKKPVLGVGRVTSPDDMVEIIKSGQADIIGAARPSIADPFLPLKIDEGRFEDIRECIGCNICISRWEQGARMICTQNATANEEFRRGWHPENFEPTAEPQSVLVVGAGPSGMECARVLGLRGYDVHLVEAEAEIGGHVKMVMRYPGLSEWSRVASYRQIQLDKAKNVEIHTNTRLSADDVLRYGADRVVIATGAHWAGDGLSINNYGILDGVDAAMPQFATPEQVMAGKPVGERVVVLDADGYFTGIGLAELLADAGKQVSLVSQFEHIAPMTDYTLERPNMERLMREKGIALWPGHWAESLEPGNEITVRLYDIWRDGSKRAPGPVPGEAPRRKGTAVSELACDTVVLATARVPNGELFNELKARKEEWVEQEIGAVYAIGDCRAPRLIADSIFDGHRLAREFESANPMKAKPFIRERILWGQEMIPALGK